jgi:beta-lactam-binding protein with PASTA domain
MASSDRPVLNDRYEVHSRIGRGGMADVFLAKDLQLNRPVAVKVLFPEYANDGAFVERFRREAQAAASLSHPNIVGIYDWGQQGSTYFIVMEYVQGRTLADILKSEGPMPAGRAAEVADDVAAALAHAHASGVIHRDIKPGNILMGANGAVKVADFGIARALNAPVEQGLTQAGAVMGTAAYFSPEQARGDVLDARSDLYSLGIVMYEMAAGRPPFSGDTPVAVAYQQVHDRPTPLVEVRPEIPRGYDAVTMRLLAKRPDERYRDAGQLRGDLRRFLDGRPVEAAIGGALGAVADAPTQAVPPVAPAAAAGAASAAAAGARQAYQEAAYAPTAAVPPMAAASTGQLPPTPGGPRPPVYGTPPPQYQPYEEEPPLRRGITGLAVVLIVAALAVLGWVLFQTLGGDDTPAVQVTVPAVVNTDVLTATKTLQDAKFMVDVVPVPPTAANEKPGTVIAQEPAGGVLADEGATVKISVVEGAGREQLPTVVGLSQQAATDAVTRAGFLRITIEQIESPDVPAGQVVEQRPAPGLLSTDTEIVLVVSIGVGEVPIPAVANREVTDAVAQLTRAELDFEQVLEASDTVPAGRVIRTEPAEGTSVPKGTVVRLIVSSGAVPVVVPDVVGRSETEATDLLQDAGLRRTVNEVILPPGDPNDRKVISQNPLAGSEVARNATVVINVGRARIETTTTTTTAPTTTTSSTTTTTSPPGP